MKRAENIYVLCLFPYPLKLKRAIIKNRLADENRRTKALMNNS
jgi:hypothetical protein